MSIPTPSPRPRSRTTAARKSVIPFMKGYTVFNVEQIDGLPNHYYIKPEPVIDPAERITHADALFAATGADIRHGGDSEHYAGDSDHVDAHL